MTGRERCEEILRLIDLALGETPAGASASPQGRELLAPEPLDGPTDARFADR